MSGTPAPQRVAPRLSGIPTPGRVVSGIPTPGRPRSSIGTQPRIVPAKDDDEVLQRSFADAMKARKPYDFLNGPAGEADSSPERVDMGRRKSTGPRASGLHPNSLRSPSATGMVSNTAMRLQLPAADSPDSFMTAPSTPLHTPGGVSRARTPLMGSTNRSTGTYTPHRRPESRQSIGATSARSTSRLGQVPERSFSRSGKAFEVGDKVRIEGQGYEGTLRFLGEVHFRQGIWAGVELLSGFKGKGKNDGEVEGQRYFTCEPKQGIFVPEAKLSLPAPTYARPPSSASVTSATGRVTPAFMTPTSTDFETPTANRSRVQAVAAANRITAGSRAARFLNMTAQQLREAGPSEPPIQETILESPNRSTSRPSTVTPRTARQSFGIPTPGGNRPRMSLGGVTPKAKPRKTEGHAPPSPSMSLPALSVTSTSANTSLQEEEVMTPPGDESRLLESTTRSFQNRVARLMSDDTPGSRRSPVKTSSAPSNAAYDDSPLAIKSENRLLERIETLEREKKALQAEYVRAAAASPPSATPAQSVIADLQEKLKTSEESVSELNTRLQRLEKEVEEQVALRESEKEQAAAVLEAAEERIDEAERRAAELLGESDSFRKRLSALEKERDEKVEHVQELERRIQLLVEQANEEREDLLQQVEELRKAGQETIAFYEEHKATHEAERYDLEEQIRILEDQARDMPSRARSPTVQQADTVAQIDNEALREQVAHYQSRISKLEDQLEDIHADRLKLEETYRARVTKAKDQGANALKELEKVRQDVDALKKAEGAARNRIGELEDALKESDDALENARAEIEGLRTEVADRTEVRESASQMTKACEQQTEELLHLKQVLETTQHARDEALSRCEALKQDVETAEQAITELRARKVSVERDLVDNDHVSLVLPAGERRRESYGSETSKVSRRSTTDPEKELRDQIKGFKRMVQELEKENSDLVSQRKMLQAENRALATEALELKEEVKTLEEAVERTILQEEQALARDEGTSAATSTSSSDPTSAAALADLKAKHAIEIQQMKDSVRQHEQTIRNLNKEMGDYESLIESKIYEEDDYTRKIKGLENQVEKLKEKLSRAQKESSRAGDSHSAHIRTPLPTVEHEPTISEEVCELCGGRNHDITTCPALNGGPTLDHTRSKQNASAAHLWCDDCETFGHSTSNCPHSQDVF